jgi:hypothetical protein
MINLSLKVEDNFKLSKYGHLFKPENFISYDSAICKNFSKGHYTDGMEIVDQVSEAARKEIEQ